MVIIILISIIFFKTYFEKESVNNVSEKVEEKKDIKKKESNFIHNIKYVSQDKFGNNYTISSELGELNENEPELILMKNVMANINLKNSDPVKISSKNAVYNTVNYTTNFLSLIHI